MKKLLLMALVAGGFMFMGAPRSDAQVYFSIGFRFPGYYGGYYPYGYYYPYRNYYRPYYRGYYNRPYYWSGGRRYNRHYPNYYHRR